MPSTVGVQIVRPGPRSFQLNMEIAHHLSVMNICWVNITGKTDNKEMQWEEVLLGCSGKIGGVQGMGRNHEQLPQRGHAGSLSRNSPEASGVEAGLLG